MLIDDRLCKWITAGLALYKAHPVLCEAVFYDMSQSGFPTTLAPGLFIDTEKRWIPEEFVGGQVRYGSSLFAILHNTDQSLDVVGDPSLQTDPEGIGYEILPPAVAGLQQFLATETFSVLTSFAQIPTQLPAFSVRLERDAQADTWVGESVEHYVVDGAEVDVNNHEMRGAYLVSIWTTNREATLWLYAWLAHEALRSMQAFTTWGLHDVQLSGSDLDPALQFLPERVYARHLLFTASRVDRAINTREVEYVTGLRLKVFAHYAHLVTTIVPVME